MIWVCYINDDNDVVAQNLSKIETITLNQYNTKIFAWHNKDEYTKIALEGALWCEESMLFDTMQKLRKKANETPLG
jgi:hypothetical protein